MVKHVISFSGGKDSTALLLKMMELGYPIDYIVFCDTSKEFPEMYEHINRVEKHIKKEITKVKFNFDYYFSEHIKTKGKNKGKAGYGWPSLFTRWCTRQKIDTIHRWMKTLNSDIIDYHGIAFDELHRTMKNKRASFREIRYPLIGWKMTELDCLNYCYNRGFDWSGLYNKNRRLGCFCCPLKGMDELNYLYRNRPELWKQMKEMDKKQCYLFRSRHTFTEIENRLMTHYS